MGNAENTTNVAILNQKLMDHIDGEEKKFASVEKKIGGVDAAVKQIRDNHLTHLGSDVTEIKVAITKNTTDTDWLKRFFFIIAGASVASTIATVLNLIKS